MSFRNTYNGGSWRGWFGSNSSLINTNYNVSQVLDSSISVRACNYSGNTIIGTQSIYFRSGNTWNIQGSLGISDVTDADLSYDGNIAVIGVTTDSTIAPNAGAAYLFIRTGTTWTQVNKFYGSNASLNDYFGSPIYINDVGDTIFVNAPLDDTGGTNLGSVYTYTRSGNTVTQQSVINGLTMSVNKQITVGYGRSVNGLIIQRYLYRRTTGAWSLSTLPSYPPINNGQFFTDDGSRLFDIEDMENTDGFSDNGIIYYSDYDGSNWSTASIIQSNQKYDIQRFGYSFCNDSTGNTIVVGAFPRTTTSIGIGGTYIFNKDISGNYIENGKLAASDGFIINSNGVIISGDGNVIVVNSTGNYPSTYDGTYIFTKS